MTAVNLPHLVIRASAGTGKTFQLSNRLLALLHAGLEPERMLAATFARQAASEILDRVVQRLAAAALDDEPAAELGRQLPGAPPLTSPQCGQLLQRLIRRLHRCRVGTLDSFFVQLAGTFSLELGLPPGWQIVDEMADQSLRARAVQELLRQESTGDTVQLMHLLKKGQVPVSLAGEILQQVTDMHGVYRESSHAAWHALPRQMPLTPSELEAAIQSLAEIAPPNQQMTKAQEGDLAAAQQADWGKLLTKGLSGKLAAGEDRYYRTQIPAPLQAAYAPLLQHARAELLGQIANQTEATWRLLDRFDRCYRRLQQQERGLRFDDITQRLVEVQQPPAAGQSALSTVEQWSYRLDAQLEHLLLDEFQDTSVLQWRALAPLAAHVVAARAHGRSFFCVGDVKQAIYAWRGGKSEIFDAVGTQLAGLSEQTLTKSYRSSPVVIDLVNRVFLHLDHNEALADWPGVVHRWQDRFGEHTTARGNLPGYCRLIVAPETPRAGPQTTAAAAENSSRKAAVTRRKRTAETLAFAAAEVARLHAEHPGRSIGVLLRTNDAIGRLIYLLRTKHGILASEEGGNPLTDSVAVELLLSLLRLADQPGDTVAAFHVAHSPLGPLIGLERHDQLRSLEQLAAGIRQLLLTEGYGRVVFNWVRLLAPAADARQLNRMLQLVELAYRYEGQATLRPADFVAFVEQTKVVDPTTAAVRVMTIHQAKGLEFDLVVLPQLDQSLKGRSPTLAIERDSAFGPIRRVARYANQQVQALLPADWQPMFQQWTLDQVNESLCLLYVALTRAVHELHLIVAPPPPGGKWPKTFAGVVRSALAPQTSPDAGCLLFESGQKDWDQGQASAPLQPPAPGSAMAADRAVAPPPLTLATRDRRRRGLQRQSPSGLEGGQRVQLGSRWSGDSAAGQAFGELLHRWLATVEWSEAGLPDQAQLTALAHSARLRPADIAIAWQAWQSYWQKPGLQRALSRASFADPASWGLPAWNVPAGQAAPAGAGDQLIVYRERPFALREDDQVVQGSIDRVVLFEERLPGRAPQVHGAVIIDYKTDRLGHDAALQQAKVAYYRPQLLAYHRAVCQLWQLPAERVAAYLLFLEPGELVRVDQEG